MTDWQQCIKMMFAAHERYQKASKPNDFSASKHRKAELEYQKKADDLLMQIYSKNYIDEMLSQGMTAEQAKTDLILHKVYFRIKARIDRGMVYFQRERDKIKKERYRQKIVDLYAVKAEMKQIITENRNAVQAV